MLPMLSPNPDLRKLCLSQFGGDTLIERNLFFASLLETSGALHNVFVNGNNEFICYNISCVIFISVHRVGADSLLRLCGSQITDHTSESNVRPCTVSRVSASISRIFRTTVQALTLLILWPAQLMGPAPVLD